MNYQPFWFDNAIKEENADRLLPQLPENHHTDICIIGGVYRTLDRHSNQATAAPKK